MDLDIGNLDMLGVSIVIGVPPNGWFMSWNPMKLDDLGILGVPLCQETSILIHFDVWKRMEKMGGFFPKQCVHSEGFLR